MAKTQDLRALVSRLEAQGFIVERARNGHFRVINPTTGRKCQIPYSPGLQRSVLNAQTRLKRIGFDPQA